MTDSPEMGLGSSTSNQSSTGRLCAQMRELEDESPPNSPPDWANWSDEQRELIKRHINARADEITITLLHQCLKHVPVEKVKKLKDQPGVWSFCIKGAIGLMTRMRTLPILTFTRFKSSARTT